MKLVQIAALLVLMCLVASTSPPAHGAATLQADLPLYTLRDKQVALSGSGFAGQNYFVWIKSPNENVTHFSGKSFSPISGGMIPPALTLPISVDAPLGTYLVSISSSVTSDSREAAAHFGIWGTEKPLYQRTQSVRIVGGGLFSGTSFKISIRNPAGDYVQAATVVTNPDGNFNYTWRIAGDAVTETYKVIIDGTGTLDNSQQDYVSESRFTVTQATLSVGVATQPLPSYQRTEIAKITMTLKYPDGTPVQKIKTNLRPILLLRNQSTVGYASLSLTDAANGIWTIESKIPINATASPKYRFDLPALSFDDGFGNKGGIVDTFSDYFQIINASLRFSSEVNGTQIQVPFGQVSIISRISYPDGGTFFNGTARVQVSTGSSTSNVKLSYDPGIRAWRASYSSAFTDLLRVGVWKLRVEANDAYGNSGTATYEVATQPYLFIILIAALVVVVLLARWTVSRYGRKLYFKIRKIAIRLRGPRALKAPIGIRSL